MLITFILLRKLHLYINYETLQVTRLFLTLDSLRKSKHIKNNVKFKMS